MDVQNLIQPELFILVPVLSLIGVSLKRSRLPDRFIPAVLCGLSVLLCALWIVATRELSGVRAIADTLFTAITQGVLIYGG